MCGKSIKRNEHKIHLKVHEGTNRNLSLAKKAVVKIFDDKIIQSKLIFEYKQSLLLRCDQTKM